METLNADLVSSSLQQMQNTSTISFSGTKKTSTTTASKDTATISETGVKISSSRQPSQEELNAMAWTGKQFVEMFEDAGFIFGDSGFIPGLLDNGNYMHGTTTSGISIDIDRHTEASENASLEPNELDTSNVLGYSASITTSSGKLNISFVDSVWMHSSKLRGLIESNDVEGSPSTPIKHSLAVRDLVRWKFGRWKHTALLTPCRKS